MAKYLTTVRYGLLRHTGRFTTELEELKRDATVIVRSPRSVDYGTVTGPVGPFVTDKAPDGNVIRVAADHDLGVIDHIRTVKEPEELACCKEKIAALKLDMRLTGVEHLFSGDKVIFYFLAEQRVDFRELVRDLARTYRTRIEMKQIGARDQARLLGDCGDCGRDLCCKSFITNFEPVSMRMAKMQKTTLDPSKISGRCGRLKCCLRYEDEVYLEHRRLLPKKGQRIRTESTEGLVLSLNLLNLEVTIATPGGGYQTVHHSEILPPAGSSGCGAAKRDCAGDCPGLKKNGHPVEARESENS